MAIGDSLPRALLERLYGHEGLSLKQVADRLGPPFSKRVVQRALQRQGIQLRPPAPPARKQALMSRELLEQLYVNEGRNLDEVAAIVAVHPRTVLLRMRALGIDRRRGAWRRVNSRVPMTRDLLREQRANRRLPIREIAATLGYSEIQVRSALDRHGIEPRPKRPTWVGRLGASELWWLHHHEGLTVRTIAVRLRASAAMVRRRMDEVGVRILPPRSRERPARRPRSIPKPDLQLLQRTLTEAGRRPVRPGARPIERASATLLRRLHLDEGLGLTEIGVMHGCLAAEVRKRMQTLSLEIRDRRGRRATSPLTKEENERLARLYGRPGVKEALKRHRIPIRSRDQAPARPNDLTRSLVSDLYEGLSLGYEEIALLTGRGTNAVSRAIRRHRIKRRRLLPRPAGHQRHAWDTLAELATQGEDAASIASILGLPSPTTVRIAAQVLEIPLPGEKGPAAVPPDVVRDVHRAGVAPEHAAAVLDARHLGVGSFAELPPWPAPPSRTLLRYLYGTLAIGLAEIADRLRLDYEDFRAHVLAGGIPIRGVDEPRRSTRWRLDPEELGAMYVDAGRPAAEIAAELGVSVQILYRSMHRHHLPVRAKSRSQHFRVRYDDLLDDERVRAALREARLEPAGVDPPLHPDPLPPALLRRLIGELGLTPFDVELLTGRASRAVRRDRANIGRAPLKPSREQGRG